MKIPVIQRVAQILPSLLGGADQHLWDNPIHPEMVMMGGSVLPQLNQLQITKIKIKIILSMLGKKFSRQHFDFFFLFSQK